MNNSNVYSPKSIPDPQTSSNIVASSTALPKLSRKQDKTIAFKSFLSLAPNLQRSLKNVSSGLRNGLKNPFSSKSKSGRENEHRVLASVVERISSPTESRSEEAGDVVVNDRAHVMIEEQAAIPSAVPISESITTIPRTSTKKPKEKKITFKWSTQQERIDRLMEAASYVHQLPLPTFSAPPSPIPNRDLLSASDSATSAFQNEVWPQETTIPPLPTASSSIMSGCESMFEMGESMEHRPSMTTNPSEISNTSSCATKVDGEEPIVETKKEYVGQELVLEVEVKALVTKSEIGIQAQPEIQTCFELAPAPATESDSEPGTIEIISPKSLEDLISPLRPLFPIFLIILNFLFGPAIEIIVALSKYLKRALFTAALCGYFGQFVSGGAFAYLSAEALQIMHREWDVVVEVAPKILDLAIILARGSAICLSPLFVISFFYSIF